MHDDDSSKPVVLTIDDSQNEYRQIAAHLTKVASGTNSIRRVVTVFCSLPVLRCGLVIVDCPVSYDRSMSCFVDVFCP